MTRLANDDDPTALDAQSAPLTRADAPGAPTPGACTGVRVLTWNVQNAAPARALRQATWLAGSTADIAVLTEVPKADGGRVLAQALADRGFTIHASAPATTTSDARSRDYVVMIAVRRHTLEAIVDAPCRYMPHRAAIVRIRVTTAAGAGQVTVAGFYVPSRGTAERRNIDKRAFQEAVTNLLPQLAEQAAGGPLVVTGDLNVVEPGHVPAHANFGAWEYDFYRSFAECGLIDAYRHLHVTGTDHSWYGRRSGAGYRFDHLFVSRQHCAAITSCWYDHAPRNLGLSDHSALTAAITTTA